MEPFTYIFYICIYKSVDANDCNNNRGISVTSGLGKLFTSLLQQQKNMGDFLESRLIQRWL